MHTARILQGAAILTLLVGCSARQQERARADSLAAITQEQLALTTTLSAQKDSLTRIIFDADAFIMQIDSQIRTVKGLPASKRTKGSFENPIDEQIERRKEVLARVDALVDRANQTARQLEESRQREALLKEEKAAVEQQLADAQQRMTGDETMIGELAATIQRQTETIASLELRVDSLITETRTLGRTHYRAYYIVGTEDELLEKGVIKKEGGANLLLFRPGQTLQPARMLDPALFVAIDQREVMEIPVPDTTRSYKIVSRQTLAAADVEQRDEATFTGNLRIDNANQFWAPSRFLIVVQR